MYAFVLLLLSVMFLDSSMLLCVPVVHFFIAECVLLYEIYLFILLLMDI